jgi:hypothetical protein
MEIGRVLGNGCHAVSRYVQNHEVVIGCHDFPVAVATTALLSLGVQVQKYRSIAASQYQSMIDEGKKWQYSIDEL